MRYFLFAFLILFCFSFGLQAESFGPNVAVETALLAQAEEEVTPEEVMEEEVMEEEVIKEELDDLTLAEQKWTPAQADSIINALTMEEEDLKTQLADLQEQIDALQMEVGDMDAKIAELEAEKAELEKKLEQISWYKVKAGDYLCKIAERSDIYGYGKYMRWKDIYNANKDKISSPDLIRPGTNLFIPRP